MATEMAIFECYKGENRVGGRLRSPMRFSLSLFALLGAAASRVQALSYHGADFSSLINLENSGTRYTDGGSPVAFETILKKHGANLARIRVWTSTTDAGYSLNYGLRLAKRAHAAGMTLMVDLHYSDTWADPAHQSIPSGCYTKNVVTSFASQGTPITFLQLGNEINNGLLWPVGQISAHGYSPASQLLHSAASGARAASSSVRTMIHLANGWDASAMSSFYKQIFIPGQLVPADVDSMGFSFYPLYGPGATFSALKTSLQGLVNSYGKDVMVVETNWPAACSGVKLSEPIAVSAAGQETWVKDTRTILQGISGSHGIGLIYWEPGWVGNAALGSGCSDNLLVAYPGATRSSINMFANDM
ncbi:unnamed protein product [Mycena citricolor]|uniref:Arabinogalactan endo-beta-1,4-galactanase n=1 Tax=Mycena citricolor TaxID=2018698 RepID=A0AAD2Q0E9_9AGAR|nr:unnamed protein product [Mycena citricolor]